MSRLTRTQRNAIQWYAVSSGAVPMLSAGLRVYFKLNGSSSVIDLDIAELVDYYRRSKRDELRERQRRHGPTMRDIL